MDPRKPLVAVVSRLVPQKGIHLIKAALFRTVEKGGQFVLLGSGAWGRADGSTCVFEAVLFCDDVRPAVATRQWHTCYIKPHTLPLSTQATRTRPSGSWLTGSSRTTPTAGGH